MTPASIGGEQQINISGGCQSPPDIRSAGMRRDSGQLKLTRIPRQDPRAGLEYEKVHKRMGIIL